jgi:hypothetical protein
MIAGWIAPVLGLLAAVQEGPDRPDFAVGNASIAARFTREGGALRLAALEDKVNGKAVEIASPDLFSVVLGDGRTIRSSELRLEGEPKTGTVAPDPAKPRFADRTAGRFLKASFLDAAGSFRAAWQAVVRDGNYVRFEVLLSAPRDPLEIRDVVMIDWPLAGAKVAGYTDGAPLLTGHLFLGLEHPMAKNEVAAGDVPRARGALPRGFRLEPGRDWKVSSVAGVYAPGQERRAFLQYLERERPCPYRQYFHYNSWYHLNIVRSDNPDPLKRMTEKECLDTMEIWARELHGKRGTALDGFLWDDGWDDWETLWKFHKGFPRGFSEIARAAAAQGGAGIGVWLSPWGGYGASQKGRLRYGREQGFEINAKGFSMAGPKYYGVFRDVCLGMVRDYGVNHFKFDGIGAGMWATGPPPGIAPDLEGLLRLIAEIRQAKPDVFINCTTGTWASPFWVLHADSVWRQGEDTAFHGAGNPRERWITYRDKVAYDRFAKTCPLFPLNAVMFHGTVVGDRQNPGKMPRDDASVIHEIRMAIACGAGLQELYIGPEFLTPAQWDALAEAIGWARARAEVLSDIHWVGGDPGRGEVYGFAAGPPMKAVLTLRNPSDQPAVFRAEGARIFERPGGERWAFLLRSPWKAEQDRPIVRLPVEGAAEIPLEPFEVKVFDATADLSRSK